GTGTPPAPATRTLHPAQRKLSPLATRPTLQRPAPTHSPIAKSPIANSPKAPAGSPAPRPTASATPQPVASFVPPAPAPEAAPGSMLPGRASVESRVAAPAPQAATVRSTGRLPAESGPTDSAAPRGYRAASAVAAAAYPPKAPAADAVYAGQPNPIQLAGAEEEELARPTLPAAEDSTPSPLEPTPAQDYQGPASERPFKKIQQILPHFDYAPDAAMRRCDNLCPRPDGADCPECRNDPDLPIDEQCPECPVERRLTEVDPHSSQVAATGRRNFQQVNYCWEPSNLYHLPIYFEDFCLERYGHTRHYLLQPVVSNGLFAAQLLGLPYQMTIDPICKKRYVLGWYRPGSYVPFTYHQVPWNTEAAVVQGAAVTGGYFLFAPAVSP
ncbi:MAG: hypothetical protein ACKOJF_12480, partial [Planctomycetaceae bacterium]